MAHAAARDVITRAWLTAVELAPWRMQLHAT